MTTSAESPTTHSTPASATPPASAGPTAPAPGRGVIGSAAAPTTTRGSGPRATAASPAAPGASAPGASGTTARWGLALVVLVAGMFMSVLDVSIVNVAIPAMQNDFGASTNQIQWVATAYSLALGVVVPLSAWLGERVGFRTTYVVALVGFAGCSALCGLAWSLNSMIAFRILQAIPGGILPVITLTMVYKIVPRAKIGLAMGLYGIGIVFAPATGPTLGGYLVEYINWRLIFYINVPVGLLGALAAVLVLPRLPGGRARRFDAPGFVAIAVALFSLLLALSEGQDWGWTSYPVLILFTVGLLSLALFVVIELEVDAPLLDVRVFRSWAFTNSLLLIAVLSTGLFGVLFYIPQFLQRIQGLGAFDAGLVMMPQALVMGVMMPIAGRLYDKIGARWLAATGLVIFAIATYRMSGLTVETPHQDVTWLLVTLGLGMGLAMMPIMTGGISALPPAQVAQGSAFNNVVQRTSAAMGLAALTALLTGWQTQVGADRAAMMNPNAIAGSAHATGTAPGGSTLGGSIAGAMPDGSMAGGSTAGRPLLWMYQMTQQMQGQSFVTALDNVFIIVAALALIGAVLALIRPAGRTPPQPPPDPTSPGTAPAQPPAATAAARAGEHADRAGDHSREHSPTTPAPPPRTPTVTTV